MKASTQLIDDSTGVGYIQPLSCDEPEIFNFVINDHTIAVFWKPLAFFGQPMVMAQKSGRCDLRIVSSRTLGVTEDAAKEMTDCTECSGAFLPPSPPAEKS